MTVERIRKVAVLGAGVMGSGIAAHVANAGIPVVLLDIVPRNPKDSDDTNDPAFRNRYSNGALQKMKKQKPDPLFTKKGLRLIETGNFEDDLHRIAECDWVVEVVIENLAIKQDLFAKVEEHRRPGTIISSNTSGLSVASMAEGRSDDFRKHFLVTHFFNPVRYLKLLELVGCRDTTDEVMSLMARFGEEVLGKGIVYGKDTTNFIANRIGIYGMMKTLREVKERGYSVEEVDKIFGPAMGRAKSGVFRTADVVGLDTFVHVAKNCYDTLTDDEERDIFQMPDYVAKMVDNGWLGSKTDQGFYKKTRDAEGKRVILSLDLDTLEYTEQEKVRIDSLGAARNEHDVAKRVKLVALADDRAGELVRASTDPTLAYSARRLGEIADDIVNIDRAMRWGFGWELGPFETWDALGVKETIARMTRNDIDVPTWVIDMVESGCDSFYRVSDSGQDEYYSPQAKGYVAIEQSANDVNLRIHKQRGARRVHTNFSASLWDIGDGVACLELHSPLVPSMNPIDDDMGKMMQQSLDTVEKDFEALVLYTDNENFCAGANLMMLFMYAQQGDFDSINTMVNDFQQTIQRFRYSSVPVVMAPAGLALGGGAELVMAGNAVQAAAESYIGLVEVGMGLIPGGAGTLNLLKRWIGPFSEDKDVDKTPFIAKTFMSIGMAKVAESAVQAREAGFLRETDGITLNRAHLLARAKERAIGMARAGFTPPQPNQFRLPGRSGAATVDMLLYTMEQNHQISAHDRAIGKRLARVLTGGDTAPTTLVTEQDILDLEREAFVGLCGEPKTQERIGHFLNTKKPLRN